MLSYFTVKDVEKKSVVCDNEVTIILNNTSAKSVYFSKPAFLNQCFPLVLQLKFTELKS